MGINEKCTRKESLMVYPERGEIRQKKEGFGTGLGGVKRNNG